MKAKLLLLILLVSGCITSHEIEIEANKYKVTPPPNTVNISDNFYIDKTEITNIDYMQYLSWLESIHGKDSKILQEAVLDMTVWYSKGEDVFARVYFGHPSYHYYPVVGITLEQAKKYSAWRTQVVTEARLVTLGLIKFSYNQTSENHFTIERYLAGEIDSIIKHEDILVPEYTIPTEKEWEEVAECEGKAFPCMDENSSKNKKMKKQRHLMYNTLGINDDGFSTMITMVRWQGIDTKGIYGLIGNVSEMIDKKGMSKGGHWDKSMEEIKKDITDNFEEVNSWTGFRNVCRYKLMKVRK